MRSSSILTVISIAITWLITALVLLVYSFNYLDIINEQVASFEDIGQDAKYFHNFLSNYTQQLVSENYKNTYEILGHDGIH